MKRTCPHNRRCRSMWFLLFRSCAARELRRWSRCLPTEAEPELERRLRKRMTSERSPTSRSSSRGVENEQCACCLSVSDVTHARTGKSCSSPSSAEMWKSPRALDDIVLGGDRQWSMEDARVARDEQRVHAHA